MQITTIPSNFTEVYQLVDQAREETKTAALEAIADHIARMRDPAWVSQPDHPHHQGYRAALEFAATLVKLCI